MHYYFIVNVYTDTSSLGASVFAFDCTDHAKPEWKGLFTFHPWCLGAKQSFENNVYSKTAVNQTFQFHSLKEIKTMLGHKTIDLFKMDIEGMYAYHTSMCMLYAI